MVSESIQAEGPASVAPLPPRLVGGAGRRAEAWRGVSMLGDVVCAGCGEQSGFYCSGSYGNDLQVHRSSDVSCLSPAHPITT